LKEERNCEERGIPRRMAALPEYSKRRRGKRALRNLHQKILDSRENQLSVRPSITGEGPTSQLGTGGDLLRTQVGSVGLSWGKITPRRGAGRKKSDETIAKTIRTWHSSLGK